MKKVFFLSCLITVSTYCVYSQPTQAEIDKMMKQAQDAINKYGKDSTVKNAMKGVQVKHDSDPGSYANVENWKFPAKNTALLSALPKKVLTATELTSFLKDTYSQLSKKMEAGITTSVQALSAKYNNATKMGDAAVMGWYTDHKEEALLLILKAAALEPGNLLLLNNCAALLNLGGLEQKSVPILKYVLQYQPGSSLALNNLGQAYAGLGETDTAMFYLGRCIKIVPEHAEACNTVAMIEASKGNKEKAIENFEKSLKSAFSKPAQLKLSKIKKGSRISTLVRPRVKLPEYFNLFKYELPVQCTSTDNAEVADAAHNAFREMITKQYQAFGKTYGELAKQKQEESMKIKNANGAGRVVRKGEFMAQSFYSLCSIMAREVLEDYSNELKDLSTRVDKQFSAAYKILNDEYESKLQIINKTDYTTSEARCNAHNSLANSFLPRFADITVEWQRRHLHVYQQYFDELAYWHYLVLHPTGDINFRMRYIEFIEKYLVTLAGICTTKIIMPCEFKEMTDSLNSNEIKDFECPIDIDIAFVIGDVELNCEKFSIEGGEGLIFKYEKNFKGRQSTLNVGIGAQLNLGKEIFSTSVEQFAFVKFDGNGGCADAGIKLETSVQAGVGPVGVKTEIGYTLGIESGWDFNEGPFKGMLNPVEVQVNKNVPIYKPGK